MSYIKFAFTLSLLLFTYLAEAQTQFLSDSAHKNRIGISTGLQPGFNFQTRFDRQYQLPFWQKPSSYFVNAEATFFRSLKEHSGLTIGTQSMVWERKKWASAVETAFSNARLENKVYAAKKWEWYAKGALGYYGNRAGIQLAAAYHHNLGTKLSPTSFYSEMIYEDAYTGWLGSVGGYADFEIRGLFLIAKRLEAQVNITKSITTSGAPLSVLPFQFGLGAAWRF